MIFGARLDLEWVRRHCCGNFTDHGIHIFGINEILNHLQARHMQLLRKNPNEVLLLTEMFVVACDVIECNKSSFGAQHVAFLRVESQILKV